MTLSEWLVEVEQYLIAAADGSMSRNNSETLAAELLAQLRGAAHTSDPRAMTAGRMESRKLTAGPAFARHIDLPVVNGLYFSYIEGDAESERAARERWAEAAALSPDSAPPASSSQPDRPAGP